MCIITSPEGFECSFCQSCRFSILSSTCYQKNQEERLLPIGSKMMHYFISVFILLEAFRTVSGARIMMTSPQFGSHILEQVSIGEELASRGHEVYIAVGSRYPNKANIEKRGLKTLQYQIPDDVLYGVSDEMEKRMVEVIFDQNTDKLTATGKVISSLFYRDCAYMMADGAFLENVRRLKFDLAIVEPFVLAPCSLILPKYFGLPFISNSGFLVPCHIRIPVLPSFVNLLSVWTSLSDITFTSRLSNLFTFFALDTIISKMAPVNTTLLERYAPEFESWNYLLRQSDLFILTRDHQLGDSIPEMPNYISVAGLTTAKAKKLPKDLEDVAKKSDGIILLSFGSAAYYFPTEVIVKFLEAFSKLNETVLTKLFIPDNVKVPQNVKVSSWLPQNDILGHSKTKLFITHCGINGQHEALYHGVPMLGFPLFAEQHLNCHRAYKKEFGLEMNIQDFTSDELFVNIQEILSNPKYRSTIRKASEVFRDQPMSARQRAAFWIEHVIRHGGKHLRSPAMDLPLYQFLMLDVLIVIAVGVVGGIFLLRSVFRCLCKRSKQPTLKSS